jgi:hypothetical protein
MPAHEILQIANRNAELIAILATILLALLGYLINHLAAKSRNRQEARLAFLSAQLEKLYGPLYAVMKSNTASYLVFRSTFRAGRPVMEEPFSPEEWSIWRTWAEQVFVPSNLRILDIIEKNAHLVIGGSMPGEFTSVLAHIESTKMVLSLDQAQLRILDAFAPWPKGFNAFVEQGYMAVAAEHSRLLGTLQRKAEAL